MKSWTGIWLPSMVLRSAPRVVATSKRSLTAINSPAIDDRVTLRDLQDLKLIGIIAIEFSPRKHMCPSGSLRAGIHPMRGVSTVAVDYTPATSREGGYSETETDNRRCFP